MGFLACLGWGVVEHVVAFEVESCVLGLVDVMHCACQDLICLFGRFTKDS